MFPGMLPSRGRDGPDADGDVGWIEIGMVPGTYPSRGGNKGNVKSSQKCHPKHSEGSLQRSWCRSRGLCLLIMGGVLTRLWHRPDGLRKDPSLDPADSAQDDYIVTDRDVGWIKWDDEGITPHEDFG